MMRTALILTTLAGCYGYVGGPDDNGGGGGGGSTQAFLTVVGDRNVALDFGDATLLHVRYHDGQNQPLAGAVRFTLSGDPVGSMISDDMAVTGADGVAEISVLASDLDPSSFRITATAADADPVDWNIAVDGQQLPLVAVPGVYQLDSQFDLVSGIPGPVGDVIQAFVEMTDDPNDPASYFLDQIGGTAGDILGAARPSIDYILNDILLSNAPGMLTTFINVGDDFGQVARRFGVVSELTIVQGATPDSLSATHRVKGVYWIIDGIRHDFTVEELGVGEVQAQDIAVTLEGGTKLVVADHSIGLSYGQLLLYVLDHFIIPSLQPGSESISDVLQNMVDCGDIGYQLADWLGAGTISAIIIGEGCNSLLDNIGDAVEDAIAQIGGGGTYFTIHGDGHVVDSNMDGQVDRIQNGLWEGELVLGPLTSALAKPDQKWYANRMSVP